jgi:hypothetical protein
MYTFCKSSVLLTWNLINVGIGKLTVPEFSQMVSVSYVKSGLNYM